LGVICTVPRTAFPDPSRIIGALPFGKNVAYQLRLVAEALDNGRLAEEHLPRSYATAFLLISLLEDDFAEAQKRQLVRGSVTRPEVYAFRRELKAFRSGSVDRETMLREELRSIRAEAGKLRARYKELDDHAAEIERELNGLGNLLPMDAELQRS
jgi:hypothetical protein